MQLNIISAVAKYAFLKVGTYINKKGQLKDRIIKTLIGVRIELSDSSVWFYSSRHQTWSKRVPHRQTYYRSGSPVVGVLEEIPVERIGKTKELRKQYGHCAELMSALETGLIDALSS